MLHVFKEFQMKGISTYFYNFMPVSSKIGYLTKLGGIFAILIFSENFEKGMMFRIQVTTLFQMFWDF